VTSQQADVTTTRHHGDESSVVNMTSSTSGQYVNPRPGENANDSTSHLTVNMQLYWCIWQFSNRAKWESTGAPHSRVHRSVKKYQMPHLLFTLYHLI